MRILNLRNVEKRVAALEKLVPLRRQQDKKIVESALYSIRPDQWEGLILAKIADRDGRALTEAESAATQAYRSQLRCQCLNAGRRSAEGFEHIPALDELFGKAILGILEHWEFELFRSALDALAEGRPVSPEAMPVVEAWEEKWKRISEKAGIPWPGRDSIIAWLLGKPIPQPCPI